MFKQIGEWSIANFGHEEAVWKFLGVVEEGLLELGVASTEEERNDAIADVGIYLCDFCYQSGYLGEGHLENVEDFDSLKKALEGWKGFQFTFQQAIGELAHCLLKTKQGIRSFADKEYSNSRITSAILSIFKALMDEAPDLFILIEKTFNNTVAKRDWKKNPEQGV